VTGVLRFGAFELDCDSGELRKQGRLVSLTGQPLRVLELLASSAGHVVTRAELQRQIWGDNTHVDFDASLSTCINQVRSALGDRAAAPRFVETLPKRGYRFVAPVEIADGSAAAPAAGAIVPIAPQDRARVRHRPWSWVLAGGAIAAVTAVIVVTNRPASSAAPAAPPSPRNAVRPVAVVVLPVWRDRKLAAFDSLAASLTDALTGALATTGGDRLRVANPVAVRHLREGETTLEKIANVGAEYFVTVKLSLHGGRINVHAKVSTIAGWMLWSTDRQYRPDELSRAQFDLAAELSTLLFRQIQDARQPVERVAVMK
jgi:DNA-binding winged helix-turn-helix (wHTH) protein